MAMTNEQIIFNEAVMNGIYTLEEAEELLETEGTLNLHTFATWNKMGYSIKAGEHAVICTRLWVPKKKDKKESADGEEDKKNRMYLRKSYLFSKEQVEKKAV